MHGLGQLKKASSTSGSRGGDLSADRLVGTHHVDVTLNNSYTTH